MAVSSVSQGTEMDDELAVALVPRDVLEQALQEVRWGLSTLCPGHRSTNGACLGCPCAATGVASAMRALYRRHL